MRPLLSTSPRRLIVDPEASAPSGFASFIDPETGERFELQVGELRKAIAPKAGAARYERVRFSTDATALTDNSAILVRETDDGVRLLLSRQDVAEINGAFARRTRFRDSTKLTAGAEPAALELVD
jgi:hypothetical protein